MYLKIYIPSKPDTGHHGTRILRESLGPVLRTHGGVRDKRTLRTVRSEPDDERATQVPQTTGMSP
jgi:hypothetical protein